MKQLPLLDFTSKLFDKAEFDDYVVVACQHLLPTNFIMFNYLFKKGLKPKNTFIIGKNYSTHQPVVKSFEKQGVYIHKYNYSSHKSFEKQFDQAISEFIEAISNRLKDSGKKIIILDDGGRLIELIAKYKNLKIFSAVEQTTSGYEKINKLNLKFPVINVARSQAKLLLESPYIARAVAKVLKEKLDSSKTSSKNILIIGKGSIGSALQSVLESEFNPSAYDIDTNKSDFTNQELLKILPNFDIIIGCTGKTVLTLKDKKYFKNTVILASSSSADKEFEAVKFRLFAPINNNPHQDIKLKGITLLNSGFPLNFQGTEIEDWKEIQLTRALMFSAICISVIHKYRNGIVELDEKIQQQISENYAKITN